MFYLIICVFSDWVICSVNLVLLVSGFFLIKSGCFSVIDVLMVIFRFLVVM